MYSRKLELRLYFLISTLLFIYLILRAILAGPLNDECFTFFRYIHSGEFIPFVWGDHLSANNHILNSALSWVTYKLFGVSEWSIRLPNLISFPVYCFAIYKISLPLSKGYLRLLMWMLAFGAHYYLEFFAYSRGYGIGISMMAMAIFLLLKFKPDSGNSLKPVWLSLLFITLATLANLNLILSLAIWIIPVFLMLWNKPDTRRKLWALLTIYILITGGMAKLSLTLQDEGHLSFGQSTLSSSLTSLLNRFSSLNEDLGFWIFFLFLSIITVLSFYLLVKPKKLTLNAFSLFYLFFILNIIGAVVIHYLFGVNYPLDRTGFHWYFFLSGLVPFFIDQFKSSVKPILSGLVFLLLLPILSYSVKSGNLYYSTNPGWREQQLSDDFYFAIKEFNQNRVFPASLYASDNFYTVVMAFKNLKFDGNLPPCMNHVPANVLESSDLLIMEKSRFPDLHNFYDELLYDPLSGMSLMVRDPLLQCNKVTDTIISLHTTTESFTNIASFNTNTNMVNKPWRLNFDLDLASSAKPFIGIVTIEVWDATNQIGYKHFNLDYFKTDISDGYRHQGSIVFDSLSPTATKVRCYIWNLHNELYKINHAQVEMCRLLAPIEASISD